MKVTGNVININIFFNNKKQVITLDIEAKLLFDLFRNGKEIIAKDKNLDRGAVGQGAKIIGAQHNFEKYDFYLVGANVNGAGAMLYDFTANGATEKPALHI